MRGIIVCDNKDCGWELSDQSLVDWRDRSCPNCNKPLMDEIDKAYIDEFLRLEKEGFISQRTDRGPIEWFMRLDTSKLKRA